MPAYRDDFQPLGTAYGERPQGVRWAMSCHWPSNTIASDLVGKSLKIIVNLAFGSFGCCFMILPVLTLARLCHIVQTKCHVANTEAMDVIATLPGTRLCVFREIHFQAVELER